jgi:multidrug efflux system membrane fusion protein
MKRLVVILLIVASAAALVWNVFRSRSDAAAQPTTMTAVPVTVAYAKQQNVPDYLETIGTVASIDAVSIYPRVNGQIMQILFKPGQEVKKSQPLFVIDPRPYQATLDQAQAQLAHDRAVLAEARTDLVRYQHLAQTKAVPQQQAQDQQYLVEQDQGTVKVDEANVEAAKLNLEYCHIASPIEGRVGTLLVDLGNYVQSSGTTSLANIAQIKPIYVNFPVPQARFSEVQQNQAKSPLNVIARSQSGKTLGTGQLTVLDNQVNTTTGTVTMQATFPNDNEALWPGAFVSVRLELFVRQNAITVPAQVVMQGPTGPYAYVLKPDNVAERVDVHVAARQEGIAVIDKGISPGQVVVTDGQYRLANNVKVRVESSAGPS